MSSNNELISSLKDFSLDESFIEKLLKIQIQKKEEIQVKKEEETNIHVKKSFTMNNNNNNNKKEEVIKFVKPKDKFFIPKMEDL